MHCVPIELRSMLKMQKLSNLDILVYDLEMRVPYLYIHLIILVLQNLF